MLLSPCIRVCDLSTMDSDTKDAVYYRRSTDVSGLVLGTGRFSEFHFDRHYHLDYHVGLVTEGAQRQHFKGDSMIVTPGSIAFMPPGEIHDGSGEGERPYTLKTFRLSPALLQNLSLELTGSHRQPEFAAGLLVNTRLANNLLRLHEAMHSPVRISALAIQTEWLSQLHFLFTQSGAIRPSEVKGTLAPAQWQTIKDYCLAHLSEKITLDTLASLCVLGRFHFLRQFKQTIGMTPHAWLLRLRLEHACTLLAEGTQTLTEVALNVGFYDQSHFNRAFRQAFGVPPSGY